MEGGDGSVSQLPSPSGDRSESPTNQIHLGVKSVSLLNIQQSSELRRHPPLGNKRWAQLDYESMSVKGDASLIEHWIYLRSRELAL